MIFKVWSIVSQTSLPANNLLLDAHCLLIAFVFPLDLLKENWTLIKVQQQKVNHCSPKHAMCSLCHTHTHTLKLHKFLLTNIPKISLLTNPDGKNIFCIGKFQISKIYKHWKHIHTGQELSMKWEGAHGMHGRTMIDLLLLDFDYCSILFKKVEGKYKCN